ncbi:hypothetical protein [Amycolatopsis antarctica]|uniref:hypothetical protein n=1 Tax=Amycolatopsis antarctica TaxID=1854586 RepID=UPI001054816F|nr:hypothetical protein [Amycolatopsis antarctica]
MRDSTLSRKHEPPPGQGPTLVWYRSSRRGSFLGALWVVGLVCFGLWVSRGFDFYLFGFWQIWLVILAGATLGFFIGKAENCAAGAEWVMENKVWVRTYELVKINAYPYSNTLNLHLTDSGDRKLEISLSRLQDDRRIWDYVYNGLLHSVVNNRADTNALARRTLGLPKADHNIG